VTATQLAVGCFIAFLFAVLTIYLDCYQAVRKTIWRVPRQFWTSPGLPALAIFCGIVSGSAFWYASQGPGAGDAGWLDTVLGSKIDNPYVRAMYTGLAVLALLRSKLLQVRDTDVGLEFFYGEGRLRCLSQIRVGWISWRAGFLDRNMDKVAGKAGFEDQMFDSVKAAVDDADNQYKTSVQSQITELRKNKPPGPVDLTKSEWLYYYRALINLVLENSGPTPLRAFGFK
jgi:hypothetical protein